MGTPPKAAAARMQFCCAYCAAVSAGCAAHTVALANSKRETIGFNTVVLTQIIRSDITYLARFFTFRVERKRKKYSRSAYLTCS